MPVLILSGLIFLSSLFAPLIEPNQSVKSALPTSKALAEELPPLDIKAEGVMVSDASTGEELITYHKDTEWSIASLTKVMTALVYINQNPDMERIVDMTQEDFVGGATLKVPIGTRFRALDLLHSSLMSSANNSTNALLRGTDMTREQFIDAMNKKAKDLGLKNTQFVEPTGLDPNNKSTPSEYTVIIGEALKNKTIAEVMAKTHYEMTPLNHPNFPIGTTNKLLKQETAYEVKGGKTGFTDGSDYNFATQIKNGDQELVIVVFGDETFDGAIESSKKLIDETMK